ncbi:hypothetical protein JZ751_021892 [Albula glossodonta]|uniref:Fe2OG dioxygenase domain-containing protein n=1 Tax=Albula glossodonta TaxID=121402 RepID=A0A8T2NUX4_9TELE|nr:hypothetical protein JZ751_021892 [Albula glossodonta]
MEESSCQALKELEHYVVKDAPPCVYYIPEYITEAEEAYLLQQFWFRDRVRQGGLPHPKGMLAEKLPDWLQQYAEKISALGTFAGKTANHVLVNEYNPGQGIMPHEDGPLYYPTVTTISLGSHTVLDFYHPISDVQDVPQTEESRFLLSLLVERRSLLILRDSMYKHFLHGIQGAAQDTLTDRVANLSLTSGYAGDCLTRGTRVSLTIRHVPKILKTTLLFGKR